MNQTGNEDPTILELDAFVHQAVRDWRGCRLPPAVRALVAHAEKVTGKPATCAAADIAGLRQSGWSDAAIHDAVQVVAYFNYINRIADALGVEPESGLPTWGQAGPDLGTAGP
jgi:uncharacterized peroxidase-related enzyme